MAQRYGGKYSPTPGDAGGMADAERVHPFQGKVPTRMGGRVNMLFVLPAFFALSAFFSEPLGMVANIVAFGLLMLSAWLTREGIRAEAAFDERTVARRPAIPRKIFGSAAMALGLGAAAFPGSGLIVAAVLGLLGGGLHLLSFGPDPLKDKGINGGDFNAGRVARAVDNAEAELTAIRTAIEGTRDRALIARMERFLSTARDMFRSVERDPRDLTAARRYLGVYLTGAREASEKFAAYYNRTGEAAARDDYLALLDDLETNFAAKTETLMADDRTDLDIEVEVLRERLEREATVTSIRTES